MNLEARRVWPGRPLPLGAAWDGHGVNFAIFSETATGMELCLFDSADAERESERLRMTERTDNVWHAYLPDASPGQLYGYRASGPYEPEKGRRFNANKVLLDPYARLVGRDIRWDDSLFGYRIGEDDLSFDDRDSARFAPLGVVHDDAFSWDSDAPPRTPWSRTLIYEMHVAGLTKRMPGVPEEQRGTYLGLASEAAIDYLLKLGVTAVELLPVHHRVNDRHLLDRGLSNYWGYNTLAFFAPDTRFACQPASTVSEFKTMIARLHQAGLEVILDVVYNHTGEGSSLGPTLSLRGLDNAAYYWLSPESPRHTMDTTGCGNTPNLRHSQTLQLILDSLRYWVEVMHVDGFRFDLAATLARDRGEFDARAAFLMLVHQDPVLSHVKLIAEPWDVGPDGYRVGQFPVRWSEWNAEYRDAVRRFWMHSGEGAAQFASRLCGSSDLFERSGRRTAAGVNFVTCHDGFTLADLVGYSGKHNEANGEENRDGTDNNISGNFGAEGPTDDPAIRALRQRQQRNLLATLFFSQGVPMLLAGDELGQTQRGNNNAYCQDNELAWLNWELDADRAALLEFTRKLSRLRHEHPALRRGKFFQGRLVPAEGIHDISWFRADGAEMAEADWSGPVKTLGIRLAGDLIDERDDRGQPIVGETLCLLFNAGEKTIRFQLPPTLPGQKWELLLNTAVEKLPHRLKGGGDKTTLQERSVKLYRSRALIHTPRPSEEAP